MNISPNHIALTVRGINYFLQKYIVLLAWIVGLLFFFSLFTSGLAKGGRWDLYEAIAMADRWPEYFGYSQGLIDRFMPSTPYFPGVSFLAIVSRPFGDYQVEALLFVASACVIFLQYMLFLMYRSNGGTWSLAYFFIFSVAISYFSLSAWLEYAKEFKPDTISLALFIVGALALLNLKNGPIRAVLIVITLASALLFKQQIIAPVFGLALVCVFRQSTPSEKIKDLIYICSGMLLGLLIVASINGGFFYAISSHIGRDRVSILDKEHLQLLVELIGVLLLGIAISKKPMGMKGRYALIIPAFAWFFACIAGAINLGGNIGNTAVGIVLFIPIMALICQKTKPAIISLIGVTLIFYIFNDIRNSHWLDRYERRVLVEAEIRQAIGKHNPKSILISGDSYMSIRNLGIETISEIDTWAHIHIGKNKSKVIINGNSLIEYLNPDAIVCIQRCVVFDGFYSFRPLEHGYTEERIIKNRNSGIIFVRNDLHTNVSEPKQGHQ